MSRTSSDANSEGLGIDAHLSSIKGITTNIFPLHADDTFAAAPFIHWKNTRIVAALGS